MYKANPNSEKFVFLLENCANAFSLRKIHACIITFGFSDSNFLGSKLLNCYARFGFLAKSRFLCDRIIINNNLSIWNSILVSYHRGGQYSEVLRRYCELKQRKIGLGTSAITFCLKSCIERSRFGFGKGVHVDAFKFGINTDGFVGSSLIGLYSKIGEIGNAGKVFDEMSERDVVGYTSMITVLARAGGDFACKAFDFIRCMQKEQLFPNRVTLVSLLQAAAELEALDKGRSIHGYAIRNGIGVSDEVFETSLINLYIKCGVLNNAASVFRQMKVKRIGSWNAMINGLVQTGQLFEAMELFHSMIKQNLTPDSITLAALILCCADSKHLREGKSIHAYILRLGHHLDLVSATALVNMYANCNSLSQARKLFDTIESKDAISYSVMMAGYLENNFPSEAIRVFAEMTESGIQPNLVSILSLLSAVSDLKDSRQGRCVHGYILTRNFHTNIEIANQLIHMYAKCRAIPYARRVFDRIRHKDLVSWTTLLSAENAEEAMNLFRIMTSENVNHDSVTLVSLVQAFSQLGCLNLAKEVHCRLLRVPLEKEELVLNSLITTYSRLGKLEMSRNLFEQSRVRSRTTWNAIIGAYGMHGSCVEALRLFNQMKENVKPDEVTFTSILSACSHSGFVNEGIRIFNSMVEEYAMNPREKHYSCIVDMLSRAGRVEEAYEMVKLLPEGDCGAAFGAFLAACRVHGDGGMGEVIGQRLLEMRPENSSSYSLVANVLAEGGKWDEVARVRELAKERGLKMSSGTSLIEL